MNITTIIIIILAFFLVAIFGFVAFLLFGKKESAGMNNLMAVNRSKFAQDQQPDEVPRFKEAKVDDFGEKIQDQIIEQQKKEANANTKVQMEEDRLYHAGIISDNARRKFKIFRIVSPIIFGAIFLALAMLFGIDSTLAMLVGLIGLIGGYVIPGFWLDRKIAKRSEDIMYYLPLVIEQIAIGISSSLDIGPCIQRLIQMADERDTHNVVTELLKHAERYIRSGVSMEDAMTEIGVKSGHVELKHSFMALAQVAKHGGEISYQLQELASAVSKQREVLIEAKIKKLELKATGPVGLVFMGFMMTLLSGILLKASELF